jgi:hypothetical protein
MLQSFLHSLAESNALWLIWAAFGVLFMALCIVLASVMLRESDEPLYSPSPAKDDDGKMIV